MERWRNSNSVAFTEVFALPETSPELGIGWIGSCGRAGAADQLGLHHNFLGVGGFRRRGDAPQQRLGGEHAHFSQRLPYGRERRVLKCCALNVVEAYYRDILRDLTARFAQCLNRADRGDIVERKKSRERLP